MRIAHLVTLFLVGLVTAEASFGDVYADQQAGVEARAPKGKKPSTPKTPATPKIPTKSRTPTQPKVPTKSKIPIQPKGPTKSKTPTKSATPSATAALKGPFTPYVVYTKKPGDKASNAKLKKLLTKHVKNPAKDIKEHGIKGTWINYWELPLNKKSVIELNKNKQFGGVTPAKCKGKCFNPYAAAHSEPAEPELVFFAQREKTKLEDYNKEFHYDDRAGEGVTCYLLDDGADENIAEFAYKKPRFIYPDKLDAAQKIPGPTGLDHGTCMLSKYVGKDYGIAKKCTPVVVKVPFDSNRQVWLNGLTAVKKDVETYKVKKAVLSMSVYWPISKITEKGTTTTDEGWINNVFENLKELARLNVFLVAAAGNTGIGNLNSDNNVMEGYPAIMGSSKTPTNRRIPSMIVVGAMHATTGKMWPQSNFDNAKEIPHVFAPGEQVQCWKAAQAGFPHAPSVSDGTSLATASVAGLAAYFMSLPGGPTTPTAVKKKIEDTAWWQGNGGITGKVNPPTKGMVRVWNEVTVNGIGEQSKRVVRGVSWRHVSDMAFRSSE